MPDDVLSALPTHRLDRAGLTRYVMAAPNLLCAFLAVMGWGQQNRRNLALAWSDTDRLASRLAILRGQAETRADAFDLFCTDQRIAGLGPAYFTKLIAFFRPDLNGYVLDQFTARSINLLSGRHDLVPMVGKNVAQGATGRQYEDYCAIVDDLTALVNARMSPSAPVDGSHVEYLLFGKSDRIQPWREYLKANDGLG